MSRVCVSVLVLLLVSSEAFAGQFCAIDNAGNQQACFPVMNMCQEWVAHQFGASCVFTNGPGTSRQPSNADYYAAGKAIGAMVRSFSPPKKPNSMTESAAGRKCDELGFRVGSPAYRECVAKLMD